MIERLIEYVARHRPDFPSRIAGATTEQIVALESAVGGSIPCFYREFLTAMGAGQGGLDFSFGGEADIASITAMTASVARPGALPLVEGCESYCLIGICPQPGYLIVLTPREGADPPAYFAEDELVGRYADSFEKLLFRSAFHGFVQRAHAHRQSLQMTPDTPPLDEALRYAESLGFTSAPGSDSIVGCVERPDATAAFYQYSGHRVTAEISAASAAACEELAASLTRSLAMARVPSTAGR